MRKILKNNKWKLVCYSLFSVILLGLYAILEPYHFAMQSPVRYGCLSGGLVLLFLTISQIKKRGMFYWPAVCATIFPVLMLTGFVVAAFIPDCYSKDQAPSQVTFTTRPFYQISAIDAHGNLYLANGNTLEYKQDGCDMPKVVWKFDDPIEGIHCMKSGTVLVSTDKDRATSHTTCHLYKLAPFKGKPQCIQTVNGGCYCHWSLASHDDTIYICQYGPRTDGFSKQALRSTDMGKTWDVIYQGDVKNDHLHMHRIAVDPYTGDVWLTTGDGVGNRHTLCSHDRGDTWTEIAKCQATSIGFTSDTVYFGDDLYNGKINCYSRKERKFKNVLNAKDYGVFGGSAYDLTIGTSGLVYVPFRKYTHQRFAASIWVGRGTTWKLFFVCESYENREVAWRNIVGPDKHGQIYIGGHKFKELTEEQFRQLPEITMGKPTFYQRALIGLGIGVRRFQ